MKVELCNNIVPNDSKILRIQFFCQIELPVITHAAHSDCDDVRSGDCRSVLVNAKLIVCDIDALKSLTMRDSERYGRGDSAASESEAEAEQGLR
jgi:hypothetical protein